MKTEEAQDQTVVMENSLERNLEIFLNDPLKRLK